MTLNQILKELEVIAQSHKQIDTFAFGDFHEINTSGDIRYPLMWAFYDGVVINEGVQQVNFNLVFCDVVKQGEVNETEVLSDQLEIAKDVIAQLNDPMYSWNFDANNINIQPFTERWTDSVSGYSVNITLELPYTSDRCVIPMIPIEGSTSGGGTGGGGDCAPASVVNSDMSYVVSVASGGVLTLPDTTYALYVDSVLQSSVTEPTLKNLTININWV
jgi:hypothetical protein